jgi:hypothetical protein
MAMDVLVVLVLATGLYGAVLWLLQAVACILLPVWGTRADPMEAMTGKNEALCTASSGAIVMQYLTLFWALRRRRRVPWMDVGAVL